jgi:hypothetical protein
MIRILTDNVLVEIVDRIKHKPNTYRHMCWAGGAIAAVNTWSNQPTLKCSYAHQPYYSETCGQCDGMTHGMLELQEHEISMNYGIDALAKELMKEET